MTGRMRGHNIRVEGNVGSHGALPFSLWVRREGLEQRVTRWEGLGQRMMQQEMCVTD